MIDIHTHILQNVDHGAGTIKESTEIIRKIASRGKVKALFMTPHFFPGTDDLTKEQVLTEFEKLKSKIREEKLDIQIYPGGEMRLTSASLNFVKNKQILTLNNSCYLLIELPYEEIPLYAPHYLFEFQRRGYQPIIAHFDRAGRPDLKLAREWKGRGILFQGTSYSLSGVYGKWVKRLAFKMLQEKIIDFWGSDIHSLEDVDKYSLDLFPEKFPGLKITNDYWQKITSENPQKIINNELIRGEQS